MAEPFFSIGHSNRPLEAFVALLRPNGVSRVVDVRTVPRSRANPQYNKETLARRAGAKRASPTSTFRAWAGCAPATGGLAPEVNGFWENQSFHNYADHALTPAFARASIILLGSVASSVRVHVRRGGLVAVPPPHHHRYCWLRARCLPHRTARRPSPRE